MLWAVCDGGSLLQVSDLKPDVLTHIQRMLDPRGGLFEGSVMDSGSKVSSSKGKPVRHLDRERGVAGLLPLTLILDVKHQQFWQPSDSQYVLHCERYCYFPRSSTVRPSRSCDAAPHRVISRAPATLSAVHGSLEA